VRTVTGVRPASLVLDRMTSSSNGVGDMDDRARGAGRGRPGAGVGATGAGPANRRTRSAAGEGRAVHSQVARCVPTSDAIRRAAETSSARS
jgi:hypothetical protein